MVPGGTTTAHRVSATDDNWCKTYVWDLRYIDAPAVRWYDSDQNGTVDDTLYYLNDANFNVTAVIDGDPTSGTVGEVVERYAYDPYGRVTVLNGENGADADVDGTTVCEWDPDSTGDGESDVYNRILYCGYRLDPETGAAGQGLYHVRNRHYLPTLGRWISRDPLNQDQPGGGYHDGMGLYEYVRSAPAHHTDSSGLARRDGKSHTCIPINRLDTELEEVRITAGAAHPDAIDAGLSAATNAQRIGLLQNAGSAASGVAKGVAKGTQAAAAALDEGIAAALKQKSGIQKLVGVGVIINAIKERGFGVFIKSVRYKCKRPCWLSRKLIYGDKVGYLESVEEQWVQCTEGSEDSRMGEGIYEGPVWGKGSPKWIKRPTPADMRKCKRRAKKIFDD